MWAEWKVLEKEYSKEDFIKQGLEFYREILEPVLTPEVAKIESIFSGDRGHRIQIVLKSGFKIVFKIVLSGVDITFEYDGAEKAQKWFASQVIFEYYSFQELLPSIVKFYGIDWKPIRERTEEELANYITLDPTYSTAGCYEAVNELNRRARRNLYSAKYKKCAISGHYFHYTFIRQRILYLNNREDSGRNQNVCILLVGRDSQFQNFIDGSTHGTYEVGTNLCIATLGLRGSVIRHTYITNFDPNYILSSNQAVWPEDYFVGTFELYEECDHYYRRADRDGGEPLCPACSNTLSPTGKLINGYSTKAPDYLKFLTGAVKTGNYEGKKELFFGAEIELEDGGEIEASLLYKKLKDFMLCKSDGSINRGFEIVTTPATVDVHAEKAKILFDTLDQTDMVAKSNCGLHFHVSRNALTTLQLGKMLDFIYNPENKSFIVGIAGRESKNYGSLDAGMKLIDLAPENYHHGSHPRYSAINLSNEATIEFRIFASTTSYEQYMYRLEFCKALISYTRTGTVSFKSLADVKNKDFFIQFIKDNKKEYQFLAKHLGLKKPMPVSLENK